MSPFLRIGFSSFEMDPGLAYHEEALNPYCAVYMKEAVETGQFNDPGRWLVAWFLQSCDQCVCVNRRRLHKCATCVRKGEQFHH